ncbi:sensor histidine kinase [Primorskyibacter flagellatus]|uniref:histidine kinase n=1 Tax=Primorskyibacter flagellatus TaxID=1387277 RepID=A0A917EI22_9RHOB|nr:histidine kinase dimerization/phosphoacceptor domain -containing protein [Primorskyibacter flagellatus]GGE43204.1 sensor histidine kinase [Primorskyibacter flagellatus]
MKAIPPTDQDARLRDLYDLDVLDSEAEQKFDDVVRLASQICNMPISLISLVDEDRQWFKAAVGMAGSETPIEQAICAHAILNQDYLEIADTRTDPRTAANPLVTGDENLRFYAGAVLRSARGHALGTLCVLDNKPNRLTPLQSETLRVLARQVMGQLELRRAVKEAELLRREVDHRVKNSLQSVAALTRIQARMAESQETRDALELTRRRIDTIALLHQLLYAPKSDGLIALDDFIPRVVDLLQDSAPSGIRLDTKITPVALPSSSASAVGIILNEFASNAFKHAFDEDQIGVIRITIEPDGPGYVLLTCADNGRGIDKGDNSGSGLGMRIIAASAEQLGGTSETTTGPLGTTTKVRIALPHPA